MSVYDNIFNVCRWTDNPPNPIKKEVSIILKNNERLHAARRVTPVVTSNSP